LFAYFEEGGQFYLVQEFIEGDVIEKEIYSGNFNEDRTIQLLIEILEVLSYVHEQGVIHRDLKPPNIMRRKSDGKIVLIDFGAVKEIKGLTVTSAGVTTKTIMVGTRGYMPMEQAKGEPRFCSDIYAVGMMGIEALTRTRASQLPQDPSTGEIIWKDKANVNSKLADILDKMIKDYWKHRYQGVDEAIGELRKIGYGNSMLPFQNWHFWRGLLDFSRKGSETLMLLFLNCDFWRGLLVGFFKTIAFVICVCILLFGAALSYSIIENSIYYCLLYLPSILLIVYLTAKFFKRGLILWLYLNTIAICVYSFIVLMLYM
jgi:serine/threonine protein kinase